MSISVLFVSFQNLDVSSRQYLTDDFFSRNAVGLIGRYAHKVLSAAGDNVSLITVGAVMITDL